MKAQAQTCKPSSITFPGTLKGQWIRCRAQMPSLPCPQATITVWEEKQLVDGGHPKHGYATSMLAIKLWHQIGLFFSVTIFA